MEAITLSLEKEKFIIESASDFETASEKMALYEYDCILLDIMLPFGSGLDLLKQLKQSNKSENVIIISAKNALDDKIKGLQIGADDYLTKPFHLSELLVRIQALIRRKNFKGNNKITFNEISIDILSKTVTVHNKKVDLTKKEIDLLLFLIGNNNLLIISNEYLMYLSYLLKYFINCMLLYMWPTFIPSTFPTALFIDL